MVIEELAYEAYRAHTGGISLASGQPIPAWDALKPEIRAAWETSAEAVRVAACNISCMSDWHNPSDPDYPEPCGVCEMRLNRLPESVRQLVAKATTRAGRKVTSSPGHSLPDGQEAFQIGTRGENKESQRAAGENQNGTKKGVHALDTASEGPAIKESLTAGTVAGDDRVLIYAGDGRCYWKQDHCGYTSALYAGVFSWEEAIALTNHAGPEKKVEFHPVPEDHIPTLRADRDAARELIQNLLDSAYPHPVEHPTMFKAWREAEKFLEGGSIAVVAKTVRPLALAAERLLAELGVTEPGAGEDNHETPAATLMDNLYEAWNNYMRAKHGQADAIFEPEGE
jgi:hypothetical protein